MERIVNASPGRRENHKLRLNDRIRTGGGIGTTTKSSQTRDTTKERVKGRSDRSEKRLQREVSRRSKEIDHGLENVEAKLEATTLTKEQRTKQENSSTVIQTNVKIR